MSSRVALGARSGYVPRSAADQFRLLAYRDTDGVPRVTPGAAAVGVAAAVIGDLMLAGWLVLDGWGRLVVPERVGKAAPAGAEFLADAVAAVRRDTRAPLRDWLRFFAIGMPDAVAAHLTVRGVLEPVVVRRLLRRSETVYQPVEMTVAFSPLRRLTELFDRGERLAAHEVLLAGLAQATGLGQVVWGGVPPRLADWVGVLPGDVRVLIGETAALVGDMVATGPL